MSVGKQIRLSSWMKNGRSFLIAFDEIIPRGYHAALVDPAHWIDWLTNGPADGLVLHAGTAIHNAHLLTRGCPWIMKLTTNSAYAGDRTIRGRIGTVEHALALGASGVALNIFIGSASEQQQLDRLTTVVETGERWGMPVIAFINPPEEKQFDAEALAYVCRIGAELGADVIKTNFSGSIESFHQVTQYCPAPIMIEDTPLSHDVQGTLDTVQGAITAGGAGVLFGHRIWGEADGKSLAASIKQIIHP
jgi:fructose-bisphosphate aldolase/2-amino-3,7-dideoxy-D-threo-hept-6-ulosonate synthase